MEQIHKKIEEYHRLEALRHPTNNATIATSANSTSNSTANVEEAVATRGLLRKVDPARPSGTGKEHQVKPHEQEKDHVELGRTVRALRAAAIAQAQKDGTWHVNPALGMSLALKTAVHKHKSKDKYNVRVSVEENNNTGGPNSRTIGQAKESVWWKWW